MDSNNLLWVIIAALALGICETGALKSGCSEPEERCVPIRLCAKEYNRIKKGELSWNSNFIEHLKSIRCAPIEKMHNVKHICCKKRHIECKLNGEKGACLLREDCPLLRYTSERKLMKSDKQNLCYVHDSKKYFCCTDPYCAQHKTLCERKMSVTSGHSTLYPKCSGGNGIRGSLVPKTLCGDRSRFITQIDDHRVCCLPPSNPNQLIRHRNSQQLADMQCGTVTVYLDRIQNGTYAQRGEFPWMANLVYRDNSGMCSGTLIHPSYVLTARHCLTSNLVGVRLGVRNVLKISKREQQIGVEKKILSNTHDVGLLRLAKPALVEGPYVRPICLPVYESLRMYLPSNVTITGWGLTEKRTPAKLLMKADTQVLTNEKKCAMDHICTGGLTLKNHCNGDSGGPYQALSRYGGKTRFVQYGVISDGPADCSNPKHISRGVLVAHVMNWILNRIKM